MTLPLPKLIEGITASLRDNVLPELSSDYARAQVEAIVNLMMTISLRAEWSTAIYYRQLDRQAECFRELSGLLAGCEGADVHLTLPPLPPRATSEMLEARVQDGNMRMIALLRLLETDSNLPAATARAALAILDRSMSDVVAVEWRSTAENALAKISKGRE